MRKKLIFIFTTFIYIVFFQTIASAEMYNVKKGDTLQSISKQTGESVKDICLKNNIDEKATLFEGQQIIFGTVIKKQTEKEDESLGSMNEGQIKMLLILVIGIGFGTLLINMIEKIKLEIASRSQNKE